MTFLPLLALLSLGQTAQADEKEADTCLRTKIWSGYNEGWAVRTATSASLEGGEHRIYLVTLYAGNEYKLQVCADSNVLDVDLVLHDADGNEIAGIIMEPINYNQGCIVADTSYLQFVRDKATDNGSVLIYDETLSAFRTGPGCAQDYYGVSPDLCVLGKAVANGGAIVVLGGKKEVMNQVGPIGDVSQSGTFTGNPPAVNCALASVNEITKDGFYDNIEIVGQRLYSGMAELLENAKIPARVQGLGARFGFFFGLTDAVETFDDTLKRDREMSTRFIRSCADHGVYFHDYGELVAGHHGVSASHSIADIDEALNRIESAIASM